LWQSWKPHLIFMDMRMPVVDGYEATQQIKQYLQGQATVIIALTASALEQDRAVVMSAGCDDFIRKPFRVEVLLEKIAQHLGVQFLYEDTGVDATSTQTPVFSTEPLTELTTDALAVMPTSWIETLYQGAIKLNSRLVKEAIAQIPQSYQPLAKKLTELTDDFRYDVILEVAQEVLQQS
ncbi:MAG: response regulator, partial [Oscillatoriales cyanobacterium SM2_3_0]|nr:response regulator [Oscillatoriales cyanobacterium SM2_3_0]